MLIMFRHNQLMTSANPERTAEAFKKVPFVLYFATHIDEQANFADLLLPEKHFMERLELFLNAGSTPINPATGYYYWSLRQPLVEPIAQPKFVQEEKAPNPEGLRHFMDGQLLMNQGNFAMAIIEFQQALGLDPNVGAIHTAIAECYWNLGKTDLSGKHLSMALKADPNDEQAMKGK